MEITKLQVRKIDKLEALSLIFEFHYSKVMPRLTEVYLGGFLDGELVGVLTLGWGVRPLHTIRRLFPSLGSADYYEIGKMCMAEKMPTNSESVFLSRTIRWIKENTDKKLLFTWADGVLGKPGYVYQGSNFQYGGFIWTDLYLTADGEKIHPRTSQGITNRIQKKAEGVSYGHRPTRPQLKEFGWSHIRGKQFRYIYFLCDKRERRRLLGESTVVWNRKYPKHNALEWKIQNLDTGEWSFCSQPYYNPDATNVANKSVNSNIQKIGQLKKSREFFDLS